MADLLDEQHAQAGLALLAAEFGASAFDGAVPNPTPPPPYVVTYTVVEWAYALDRDALDGLARSCTVRWYVHCVGGGAKAARAVAMRARAALLNQRPVIAGRSCGLIRQDSLSPPQRDESTETVVMDCLAIYSLKTQP